MQIPNLAALVAALLLAKFDGARGHSGGKGNPAGPDQHRVPRGWTGTSVRAHPQSKRDADQGYQAHDSAQLDLAVCG